MKNNKPVYVLLVVFGIAIIGMLVYFFYFLKSSTKFTLTDRKAILPTPSYGLKTFKSSETMDFTVELPVEYEIEERFGSATLSFSKGKIRITHIGTNYDNLDEHIAALGELNRVSYTKEEDLIIDRFPAQKGVLENKKIYFIFAENGVYAFSTEQPELYDDLDQIVRSFRYTPN